MKISQGLFMAESEGYLDTRESKINKAIRIFCASNENRHNNEYQTKVFNSCRIDPETLTTKEKERIKIVVDDYYFLPDL